jgi:hypothetical protein
VLVSMFTAIAATRAMLGLLSDFEFFNKAAFMGVSAAQLARGEQEMAAERALFDATVRDGRERAGRRAARSAARRDGGARPAVAEAVGGASAEASGAADEPSAPRPRPKPSRTSRGPAPRKKKRRR